MPRIPALGREDISEDARFIYDEIAGSRGEVAGPFPVLLNSPEVAGRLAHLGTYIRFESTLSETVRELIILATAREWDCQYEWTYHEPEARKKGVPDETIRRIRDRQALEGSSSEEATVVRYVQETLREHRVSEDTFKAALERFGAQGVTELTATLGYYSMLACVLNALEMGLDPGMTPLLPV